MLYACVLVIQQECETISYVLICWYFLSKTERLLENSQWIRTSVRIACILSFLCFFVVLWYEIAMLNNGSLHTLCKTAFFIVPHSFSELTTIIFIVILFKLKKLFANLKA